VIYYHGITINKIVLAADLSVSHVLFHHLKGRLGSRSNQPQSKSIKKE
jgi:hypothetical protein